MFSPDLTVAEWKNRDYVCTVCHMRCAEFEIDPVLTAVNCINTLRYMRANKKKSKLDGMDVRMKRMILESKLVKIVYGK